MKGATYIPLPGDIVKAKKAVVNVQNKDNKYLLWAVLSALHPANDHADRVSKYRDYKNELNFDGIESPVSVKGYPKFERQNKK